MKSQGKLINNVKSGVLLINRLKKTTRTEWKYFKRESIE